MDSLVTAKITTTRSYKKKKRYLLQPKKPTGENHRRPTWSVTPQVPLAPEDPLPADLERVRRSVTQKRETGASKGRRGFYCVV